jgi:DNA-nicking Smr family endonuclease
VPREIYLQWCHGNRAIGHGMKIRARPGIRLRARRTDPVDRTATGIGRPDHRLGPVAVSQSSSHQRAQFVPRPIRNVDIQDGVARQWVLDETLHHRRRDAGGRIIMGPAAIDQRYGDRRQTEETSFSRGRYRAGIEHIISKVGTVVDAGYHHIRFEIQEPCHGEVDAIRRSAVDEEHSRASLRDPERRVQRQGIAGPAPVALRRDYNHFAEGAQMPRQAQKPLGPIAVVVADEDFHCWTGTNKGGSNYTVRRRQEMPPSDDDRDLFRRMLGDVKRVRTDKVHHRRSEPEPAARFRRNDEAEALSDSISGAIDPAELETGEELTYRRPQVRPADFRRLRRGQISIADEIDLHGLSAEQARQALAEFLVEAVSRGMGCVRVIHGKGLRSGPAGPVIKRRIGRWLRRRDEVLAFCSARPVDGGTGAIYVLLRAAP